MHYIRKLGNSKNIAKFQVLEDNDIDADVLKDEFRTQGNTLSFWKCEDISQQEDILKAILLSSSKIVKSDFIIVDESLIKKYKIETNPNMPGKTGYKGFEDKHVDFDKLTYIKIGDLIRLYKEIINCGDCIISKSKHEITEWIIDAIKTDKIDYDNLNKDLKNDLEEIRKKNNL